MRIGIGMALAGQRAGPSPRQFLGAALLAFWDAERPSGLAISGGAVTSWTDAANGHVMTQAHAPAQPNYSATAFNGRPAIAFDGVDDFLEMGSVPFPLGAESCEIWALVNVTSPAGDGYGTRNIFCYGNDFLTSRRLRRDTNGTINFPTLSVGDGAGSNVAQAPVDISGRHVLRGVVGAAASNIAVDGGAPGVLAIVPATTGGRTRIAASSTVSAGVFFQGYISAILVTAPLGDAQAAQLMRWLKDRGGIA